jgi:ribonuclease HII
VQVDAIGADEAGRGPLAGPVVAAAVWLPNSFDVRGLDDSKKLTREQRERAATRIREAGVWHVEFVWPPEIDAKNILWASMAGLERAVTAVSETVDCARVLIDGNRVPPGLSGEAMVKGDARFACIAAASILAKTARDAWMADVSDRYPEYGFASHFGYPTPEHLAALRRHGPCPIHRRSYAPVQEALLQRVLFE